MVMGSSGSRNCEARQPKIFRGFDSKGETWGSHPGRPALSTGAWQRLISGSFQFLHVMRMQFLLANHRPNCGLPDLVTCQTASIVDLPTRPGCVASLQGHPVEKARCQQRSRSPDLGSSLVGHGESIKEAPRFESVSYCGPDFPSLAWSWCVLDGMTLELPQRTELTNSLAPSIAVSSSWRAVSRAPADAERGTQPNVLPWGLPSRRSRARREDGGGGFLAEDDVAPATNASRRIS